jgi:hypothetical protein
MQDDIFYADLTIRQQLNITSHLRLPSNIPLEVKSSTVEHVIQLLHIEMCADTMIKLLSGGEKKRCNIATELLTNPSILLLDEPTSGLDSNSAAALIQTLRSLCNERMTLLTSIHQPTSHTFYSFDTLVFLVDGHTVYHGPPKECMRYLSYQSYTTDKEYNPSEYMMDLVTTDTLAKAALVKCWLNSPHRVQYEEEVAIIFGIINSPGDQQGLVDASFDPILSSIEPNTAYSNSCTPHPSRAAFLKVSVTVFNITNSLCLSFYQWVNPPVQTHRKAFESDSEDSTYPSSYYMQFSTLFRRALLVSNGALLTPTNIIQTFLLALITGFCWFQMPHTENTIKDRASYLFFFMSFWFFANLYQGLFQFLPERPILMKERASGSYRLSAYYFSKSLSELPLRIVMPFLYLTISFPLSRVSTSITTFFAVSGILLLVVLCGESIGLFIGTVSTNVDHALLTANIVSNFLLLSGGYFVQHLPVFMWWVSLLSPFKYSYDACILLVFDYDIQCDNGKVLRDCRDAKTVPPSAAWEYLGQTGSIWVNTVMLMAFILIFRVASYYALRYLPHNSGRI